ncbi:translocation/assembly module TamB domain-containing protein [bacterium]|nr:translocation/assembly module TamB domain-containing protein [bacterium]
MRRRTWVLVVLGFLVLISLGVYTGWRATRANEKLKNLLLARIEPFVAQGSGITSLDINLSSVRMQGVRLIPKNRVFELQIDGIEIGYRFRNVIRYGFSPRRVAHEIILLHPVLIVHEQNRPAAAQETNWEAFQDLIGKFTTVQSFTVVNAAVVMADSLNQVVLASDLDGWMQTTPVDSAQLRLSGRLFESGEKNLRLEGKINLQSVRPHAFHWLIEPSVTPESMPLLIPDFIQIRSGIISGEGFYSRGKSHEGSIHFREGAFCFQNYPFCFNQVDLNGSFHGRDLVITGDIADFNGSQLSLDGTLKLLLSPEMDVKVRCDAFQLAPFFRNLTPKSNVHVRGTGRFDLQAEGVLNNPAVKGRFDAAGLNVSGYPVKAVSATMTLADSVLQISGQANQEPGLEMNIENRIDFSRPEFLSRFNLHIGGDLLPNIPVPARKHFDYIRGQTDAFLTGPLLNMRGELNGQIQMQAKSGSMLRFDPRMHYHNHQLQVRIQSNGSFLLTGLIDQFLTVNQNWQFQVKGVELILENVFGDTYQQWFQGQVIRSDISSHKKGWMWHAIGVTQETDSLAWDMRLENVISDRKHQLNLTGKLYPDSASPVQIDAAAFYDLKRLQIKKFNCDEFISFTADIPRVLDDPIQCRIQLKDLALSQFYPVLPQLRSYRGSAQGLIQVTGSRRVPHVDLKLQFSDWEMHGLTGFHGNISGVWDRDTLRTFGCRILQNDEPLLAGNVWTLPNDSLKGTFYGQSLNLNRIAHAITGFSDWTGKSTLNMQVFGKGDRPALKGRLELNEGHLGRLNYETISVLFSDTLRAGWDITGSSVYISDGKISRSDRALFTFYGRIPMAGDKDMDISVEGGGDLLHVMDEFSDFVKKGEGKGRMWFRMGGRPGAPILGDGQFSVENGRIELAGIVQKIEDINLSMDLDAEDRFFRIINLSGTVRGRPFRIWNVPAPVSGWPEIRMESAGVSLGHICLETDPRGIRMHIPGLMESREEGMIAFDGFNSGQPFLIAGSEEYGPLLQGTLRLNNLRLTYPFLKLPGKDSGRSMIDFLKTVNWNLQVCPLSDVHYIRSIESPLGNVYADLQLKKDYGRLNIQGVIDEGSLQVWGNLESTEGTIEVLDMYFRPERITFDYPKGASNPIVSGRSYTTVIDSTGIPSTVWLTLTTVDDATGLEVQGGSWNNIIFKFSTDNPNLARNEADLLAAMGYSSSQIRERAYDALGLQVENLVFRPLFRPLEREIRRYLGLDVVRFSSKFSSNLMQLQTVEQPFFDPKWLFRSSRLTLGKYLAPGLFVIYSGQIQTPWKYQYYDEGLGFRHALSVEYTFRPDLFLEMEYTYDSKLLHDRREDKRIWLRHVFPF